MGNPQCLSIGNHASITSIGNHHIGQLLRWTLSGASDAAPQPRKHKSQNHPDMGRRADREYRPPDRLCVVMGRSKLAALGRIKAAVLSQDGLNGVRAGFLLVHRNNDSCYNAVSIPGGTPIALYMPVTVVVNTGDPHTATLSSCCCGSSLASLAGVRYPWVKPWILTARPRLWRTLIWSSNCSNGQECTRSHKFQH